MLPQGKKIELVPDPLGQGFWSVFNAGYRRGGYFTAETKGKEIYRPFY